MAKIGFSPPSLFLGLGAVALGAWLVSSHPGSGALFIVDVGRLFLLALVLASLLLLAERRLSRAYRHEEPASYPWTGFVFAALFGVSVAALALANGQLRSATRVEPAVVHNWLVQERAIPTMFGVPQSQSAAVRAKSREAYVTVEAWWDRETELRLPVTAEQYELALSPGRHPVELLVAEGALGIEYVAEVRVSGTTAP
jgi:hypothetical protein